MRAVLGLTLAAALVANADAAVEFRFNYLDGQGVGFNHPTEGAARRAALERAASNFGSSALGAYQATIVMDARGNASPLASAGSVLQGNPAGGGFGRTHVIRNKILTGIDLNGPQADGHINFDLSSTSWELDAKRPVQAGMYDYYSTSYHEFTHAIGWADSIHFGDGGDPFDGAGRRSSSRPGEWLRYDKFIARFDGVRLIDEYSFENSFSDVYADLATEGSSAEGKGLFFDGPHAVAANGGQLVGLFTPDFLQPGSSVSHLDDENLAYADMLMLAATSDGDGPRKYSSIELAILKDLGYLEIAQISSIVPLPASIFMFLGGLGALAFVRRRKDQRPGSD
jgi:hypothetical protein